MNTLNALNALKELNQEALVAMVREEAAIMREEAAMMAEERICNRFAPALLSPSEVAKLHGVCEQTVVRYINDGLIEALPREKNDSYRVRGNVALMLDFKALRKRLAAKKLELESRGRDRPKQTYLQCASASS